MAVGVGIGCWLFAKPGETWDLFDGIVNPKLAEEIVQYDSISVESSAEIEPLRFPPGHEILDIVSRDLQCVGLWSYEFSEQLKDVRVLLIGKRLPKSLDVAEELVNGLGDQGRLPVTLRSFTSKPFWLASSCRRFRFWAFRASAGVSTQPRAVLTPLNEEPAPTRPADTTFRCARKRGVNPPLHRLNALNNIHSCATVVPREKMDTIMDTKADWDQQDTENRKVVAAGPVSRILSAGRIRQDGHSSGPRITARLERPTRRW